MKALFVIVKIQRKMAIQRHSRSCGKVTNGLNIIMLASFPKVPKTWHRKRTYFGTECKMSVQDHDHPRSLISVPIGSAYATSY